MSDRVLILKTVAADGAAYGGFVWPLTEGAEVAAVHWSPDDGCGDGLHGLLWGCGHASELIKADDATRLWVVFEADAAEVVDLGGKVKVPSGVVRHVGDRVSATQYLLAHGAAGMPVVYGTATAGDCGSATAGYRGTATAGYRGTATAGYRGTATAGYRGTATAGDYGTATAGDYGSVVLSWWDGARRRLVVGYIGEGGLLPGVAYRLTAAHEFGAVAP